MELRLSPEDRVASAPRGRAAKPARGKARPARAQGSGSGGRGSGGRGRRGKAGKPGRNRRRITLLGIVGTMVYWCFVIGIWVGIVGAAVVGYYAIQLPSSDTWAIPERPANIRVLAANGQLMSNRGQMGGEAVALHELPHYVPAAVLAIEDRRFYEHFGIDVIGLASVLLESAEAGRITRGASTITQQLAKNLFLSPDQTLGRKVQEAVLALWLEQNYTKDEILELYLNRVYFGGGAYGIEAAAQRYFGKSARELELTEAAMLAGVLQAPSRLAPSSNPEGAAARARVVLQAMADSGFITQSEASDAAIDPDRRIRTRVAGSEYYVADWVEALMTAYLGEVDEDVIVHTTIDWELQKHAEFVVREVVAQNGSERGFSQGALVAMTPDGTVRALVGGTDYGASQYNRAVTARRQPGSAFKTFVYLAAMESGLTPDTLAEDAQFDYNGWSPQNANRRYVGTVTLRDGLAYSMNTIAARLAIHLGPRAIIDLAYRLGISSSMPEVPSIALGTAEVSLLELTGAYAPFANGGVGIIPNVITRIETADGRVLYEAIDAGPGQVADLDSIAKINAMLTYALEVGTGRAANLPGWPIAGKTGTSQSNRDAVFVGYSAHMVTGVWLGNDDNTPMSGVGGGTFPVEIWSQFMQRAHQGVPVQGLPGAYVPSLDEPQMAQQPVQQQQQPVQQQPVQQQRRTIGDLLNDLFGG